MADIEKRLNKSAWKKGAAWGTEIDTNGAGNQILPLNAGAIKQSIVMIPEESPVSAFESDLDVGDFDPVDFSLEFDARYEGLGPIIAQVFGTAGAPSTPEGNARLHTLQLANKTAGLFGTYATEKHDKIHVVPSAKPYKLTFTMDGGKLKVTADFKGDKVIDDSAIVTSFASVTVPDKHNRALSRQLVFRMNSQGGAALAGGDEVKVKNFTLEIERMPESGAHEGGSQSIIEALEEGKVAVKLVLELNRMDDVNDAYFGDWGSENEKKADLIFTGLLITGSSFYFYKFQFPRLKIEDMDYPDENIIPATVTLRGLEADTAPSGMSGITKPAQLQIQNTRTTDMLA
jgi:hypothetical protein